MSADSIPESHISLCMDLPNGAEVRIRIPSNVLKHILVALGERERLYPRLVEVLLLLLGLEEA